MAYLLNTTSDFTTNTNIDLRAPVQSKTTTFGYTQGFNPWNATLAIAYRRRLLDKLSVSVEMHYGLMDIKDNTFFSKQKFERSSGINLILSYDLFNH